MLRCSFKHSRFHAMTANCYILTYLHVLRSTRVLARVACFIHIHPHPLDILHVVYLLFIQDMSVLSRCSYQLTYAGAVKCVLYTYLLCYILVFLTRVSAKYVIITYPDHN